MSRATTSSTPLAVITGASGALGAAIHALLAQQGWHAVVTYRTRPPSNKEDTSTPGTRWVRFDGSTDDGTEALREAVAQHPGRLQAVFACIGAPSTKRFITDTPTAEFEAVHQANTLSFIRTWHAVAERARTDAASLLAIGSDAGRAARPGNGPYTAAKAALEAVILTLAKEEHPHGVRANLVAPSLIDSPLAQQVLKLKGVTDQDRYYTELPWGRPLSLDEVARVCIDLATARHWRYATGQIYPLLAATG
ncbi:SDR family NAD(P)-dependent oxidoreductase [Streptomyces coffeae]|uniref:SDR family oxidoreductase n=1 Tax=Streptomyces coffeae TaxID=621382 RepID=A0ABS1NPY1_9ACTN|nr:SDR family oxidoreductase [Streptomyces coffeae]MBL1101920.1 SDR family oxidoreductase [Streptomyces coffeae]